MDIAIPRKSSEKIGEMLSRCAVSEKYEVGDFHLKFLPVHIIDGGYEKLVGKPRSQGLRFRYMERLREGQEYGRI